MSAASTVDVIVPVYNGARFVARAISSVLSQGEKLTVHCIDDASVDESWEILRSIADSDGRVRLYRNATNRGVAVARNRVIRASSSPYIAFLDQDDEWPAGKLELQLRALKEQLELRWVVGHQQIALEPGSTRPSWCREEWLRAPQAGFIPGALLAHREAFASVGMLDETLRFGGDDTDWFARARRLSVPGLLLNDIVLLRWVHDNNGSFDPGTNDDLLALVRRHLGDSRRQ